ncbi:MAG: zinc-dependent peptidase [Phycisphaerae bacterium]|nr:zinc-dependent peptidase [Phycisphaerae bacterium]
MFGFKRKRREHIRRRPFPPAWLEILERNVKYYGLLTPEEQAELRGDIQVFLKEKRFEGCGGLTITDEIRVTIAAQACILLLHRRTDEYPRMQTVLVYPHPYVADGKQRLPDGTILEGVQSRLGESWYRGPVVLAWDDVLMGAADVHDGRNVVFHEFAHQLDSESGANEGAPALPRRSMYIAWARVLGREYAHLVDDLKHHRRTFINAYGATNPAEFFAVITEAFLEQPVQLQRRHPELYDQLVAFYQQDPASRVRQFGRTKRLPPQT